MGNVESLKYFKDEIIVFVWVNENPLKIWGGLCKIKK